MRRLFTRLFALFALVSTTSGLEASERLLHLGGRAMAMGGAFTAVGGDATAFYWNPAGLAFGPFVRVGVGSARSEMDRGAFLDRVRAGSASREDGRLFVDDASTVALGFTFMGIAATWRERASFAAAEGSGGDAVLSERLETFDLAVSLLQSLPVDDLVVAANLHYLRGTVFARRDGIEELSSSPVDARSLFDRAGLGAGARSDAFGLDLAAMYQPRDWLRLGVMMRDVTEPSFRSPSGESRTLRRHARAGALFEPSRGTRLAVDVDLSNQGGGGDDWREISLGLERELLDRALALRAGLRAEIGGALGARSALSLGFGGRLPWVVVDAAFVLSESGRDRGFVVAGTLAR